MISISKIVKTNVGRIFISILLGFGLATLFRKVCRDRGCMIYSAAPLKDINEKVITMDNKCYRLESKQTNCNNSQKRIYSWIS